jgi:hypothetical protein
MASYGDINFITGDFAISEMRPQETSSRPVSTFVQNNDSYKPYKPIYTLQTIKPTSPMYPNDQPIHHFFNTKPTFSPIIYQESTTGNILKPVYTLQTYKPTYPTNHKLTIQTSKTYKPIYNFQSTSQPSTTTTTVTTTKQTTKKPAYTGPSTYKPTYRPGFHLTPTRPMYSTKPVPTYSTTPSQYKPTFKPAVLATFRPTLSFTDSLQYMNITTTKNPFLTYPFPILPDFDPVTPSTLATPTAEILMQ